MDDEREREREILDTYAFYLYELQLSSVDTFYWALSAIYFVGHLFWIKASQCIYYLFCFVNFIYGGEMQDVEMKVDC